jgi:hypothetical protein
VLPVAAGGLVVRHLGSASPYAPDALAVVGGLLTYHLVVGGLVGLAGRYDVTIAAIGTAVALCRLYRRESRTTAAKVTLPG